MDRDHWAQTKTAAAAAAGEAAVVVDAKAHCRSCCYVMLLALRPLRFPLPSRPPMMFILWLVAMLVVIIPSTTV